MKKPVKNTCPCGQEHLVHWRAVECHKCGRKATGGNYKTAISEAEYERQCFEADMNEWYGRGEW